MPRCLPWAELAHRPAMACDCHSNAFLLGTACRSLLGGLSQPLGAAWGAAIPPRWEAAVGPYTPPHSVFLLTQCNTSPARAPAESAVVAVVAVTASVRGYTKEQLLDKRGNGAALTSARCFLKQGCLQGSRLPSVES